MKNDNLIEPYSFIFSNLRVGVETIYNYAIEYAFHHERSDGQMCNPMWLLCGYIQKYQFFDWEYIDLCSPWSIKDSILFILDDDEDCRIIDDYTFGIHTKKMNRQSLKYILYLIDCQIVSIRKKKNEDIFILKVKYEKIQNNRKGHSRDSKEYYPNLFEYNSEGLLEE